jgi:hypothetical protein
MKRIYLLLLFLFLFVAMPVEARSGCCSHHGGVMSNGCGCNDGSPLSDTCAPYYTCSAGSSQSQSTYQAPVYQPPATKYVPPTAIPTRYNPPTRIPTSTKEPTPTPTMTVTFPLETTAKPTLMPTIASDKEEVIVTTKQDSNNPFFSFIRWLILGF